MTAILNAWGDPVSGEIIVYERTRSGRVIRRRVTGEFVSYLEREKCPPEVLRALRSSRNVVGLTKEGEKWIRIAWRTKQAREEACDPDRGWFAQQKIPTYEADVPVVRRWMTDHGIQIQRPRRVYLDIETCGRVPIAEKEDSRILCWTLATERDASSANIVAQGMLEADTLDAERQLLAGFWHAIERFDQVLAWNGDMFDFPVVFERSRRAGIQVDARRWLWLDHLELFRRMNVSASESGEEKQSLALEAVSQSVLKEGKMPGFAAAEMFSSWQAGGERRARLHEYNARDVELECRIESTTGYVELLQTVCEATGIVPDTYGVQPMPQVESYMFRLGKEHGVHFPTRRRTYGGMGQFEGAYVMEPTLKGIGRDVHVADFASMYPSIVQTFNMSPDTIPEPVASDDDYYLEKLLSDEPIARARPAGVAIAPRTHVEFLQEPTGILALALDSLLGLRKEWSAKQASLAPGTPAWVEAGRRSSAYKITANSFFGVAGASSSRIFDRRVAESITQAGVWLIQETIRAAEAAPWGFRIIYADTDSLFAVGCTTERFREFVAWCNSVLYPRLVAELGCRRNTIKLAYEKQFDRIVFGGAKRYVGRYAQYKGSAATEDSKPEIKGFEYKRGDVSRLARRMQAEVIDLLLGGGVEVPGGFGLPATKNKRVEECIDEPGPFVSLVEQYREAILRGAIALEDVVITKKLTKDLREYKAKIKSDGTEGALPPHVRVAKMIAARGGEVRAGTRIAYVVVDEPNKVVIPASDWTGEIDRYNLWEGLVWPPTLRLLEAAFPAEDWARFTKVRPRKLCGAPMAGVSPLGGAIPAGAGAGGATAVQGALFELGAPAAPLTKRRR